MEKIKEIFEKLNFPYSITHTIKPKDEFFGFEIVSAKTKDNLDKFLKANKERDEKTMGLLLGYPKTAVEAYDSREVLDFEKFFASELPKEKQRKLEEEGVLRFLSFRPSRKHWQEELEEVRKLQALIRQKAPSLYQEIIKSKTIYSIDYQKKKSELERIKQRVEGRVDKLGKGIDEKIKDTIIFLEAFGINTWQSCESHLDYGTYGPYIDIESKEVSKLKKRLEEAKNENEKKEIIKNIESKNLVEREKVMSYLDEFYKDRSVPYRRRLIINPLARGWSRLENQGVGLQKIEPENIRKEKLIEYQKEMADFTKFLIDKYFKNS